MSLQIKMLLIRQCLRSESPKFVNCTNLENQYVDFSVFKNADDSTMPTNQISQNAEDTGMKLNGKFMTTEEKIHTLTSEKVPHTCVELMV